jgi:hypothetical protein
MTQTPQTPQTPEQLRENFDKQLANAEKQILDLKENLAKAEEYRLKLIGGLETLNLLNPPPEQEAPAETPAL